LALENYLSEPVQYDEHGGAYRRGDHEFANIASDDISFLLAENERLNADAEELEFYRATYPREYHHYRISMGKLESK